MSLNANDQLAFARRWTNVQPVLASYFTCHVREREAVDDLLQETAAALIRSFSQFDPNRDFLAWALGTARHRMLTYFRSKRRDNQLLCDPILLDELASSHLALAEELDERGDVLRRCIGKLDDQQRLLLQRRLVDATSYDDLASEYGYAVGSMHALISRLRKKLRACVERGLATS